MTEANLKDLDPRVVKTLGEVDHRIVDAPYVRMISVTEGAKGDRAFAWDFRFTQPNTEHINMAAVHSLEHMIAVFIRNHLPNVINFGPMGCQTGFYLTVLNYGDYDGMCKIFEATLKDCLAAKEVPLANIEQCGWAANHTLEGAQHFARRLLEKRDGWQKIYR